MVSAEFLSRHWPLDDVRIGPTLQEYASRQVYALHAAQGTYALKVEANSAALGLVSPSPEEIRRCLYVHDYLQAKGFAHIPTLLKTRAGDLVARTDDVTIHILEWVPGSHPEPSLDT